MCRPARNQSQNPEKERLSREMRARNLNDYASAVTMQAGVEKENELGSVESVVHMLMAALTGQVRRHHHAAQPVYAETTAVLVLVPRPFLKKGLFQGRCLPLKEGQRLTKSMEINEKSAM